MADRATPPIGRITKILIALTIGVVLLVVGIGIYATMDAPPAARRGSDSLPAQSAQGAGASPTPQAAPPR